MTETAKNIRFEALAIGPLAMENAWDASLLRHMAMGIAELLEREQPPLSDREKALVEAAASTIYVFDFAREHPLSIALAAYDKEE